jgi:hypothetical protein
MDVTAARQAGQEFTDRAGNYRITLLNDWQPAPYTDALGRQKTEFVYRNRDEGLLSISSESLIGPTFDRKVRNDVNEMQLRYACVYPAIEEFRGSLNGARVLLFYFEQGRWKIGTHYYLEDGNRVWILRFTGRQGSPGVSREITDAMAKSFCTVCPPFVVDNGWH